MRQAASEGYYEEVREDQILPGGRRDHTGGWCFSAGGLVAQETSDLRRSAGAAAKGAVSARYFLRIVSADRYSKSPKGICATTN